jgi:hypothetical protein
MRRQFSLYCFIIIWMFLSVPTLVGALSPIESDLRQETPHAPVMALYFPYWERSDWSYARMSDLPLQIYSGGDSETLERHIIEAENAGIDVLICVWYGPQEVILNERCKKLQDIALSRGSKLKFALLLDQSVWKLLSGIDNLSMAIDVIEQDFIAKQNYLIFKGLPVVLFLEPSGLGDVSTWLGLRAEVDPDREQYWFAATEDFEFLDVFDAVFYYDITSEQDAGRAMASYSRRLASYNARNNERRPFIATVMPGYSNIIQGGHVQAREDGQYYQRTWEDAIFRFADAVIINSFNGFSDGTHIEPSEKYGDLFLRLTEELIKRFRETVNPAPALGRPTSTSVTVSSQVTPTQTAVTPTVFPTIGVHSIEAEWPERMRLEESNSIRVALIYSQGINITPVIEVEGNRAIVATPILIGTPGPLQTSFGDEYKPSIRAILAGAAFDIQPSTDAEYQLFDQARTTWEWNVLPKYHGEQKLNLSVIIKWESSSGGAPIQYQMWRQQLKVFVETPVLVPGRPLEFFPLLTGAIGAILGGLTTFFGPRIYSAIEERWKYRSIIRSPEQRRTGLRSNKKHSRGRK